MNVHYPKQVLSRWSRSLGLLALVAVSAAAHAEDIDLFLKSPISDAARPNLLMVIDNAAANNSVITQLPNGTGSKKLDMLKDVMNILTYPLTSPFFPSCTVPADPDLPRIPEGCLTRAEVNAMVNTVNFGLMWMNTGGTRGGVVRSHIRRMDVPANRDKLWSTVSGGIPSANNSPYAKTMHEAYTYFGGKAPYAGFSNPGGWDTDAQNGTLYRSPIGDACQPNFIIYLGNGGPDTAEDGDARTLLQGLGGVLSSDPLKFSPNNFQSNWMDEYARTLNRLDLSPLSGDQKVTTYTIAIQNPQDNNFKTASSESARALLQSAALAGGGEYALGEDGQSVLAAIFSALRKMQPTNSVFAAVTLPVSVNVRGTFLNQVYMGQFRPDANAKPRWPGNLKQYQIGLDANEKPILVDSSIPKPKPVEDTARGFLLPDITSFWTKSSNYWAFSTAGASDAPDGSIVEKGGAAQRMRTDFATSLQRATRKLYTCNGNCGANGTKLSNVSFSALNVDPNGPTTSNLGIPSTPLTLLEAAAARSDLIEWVRGADNKDDENQNQSGTDVRAYIHGDLLHSRPAVVNYNRSAGDRDVVVYYGSNDGVFRAVKGGQDPTDGYEKWGFVFPEHFGKLRLLRDNDQIIQPASPKPYFADGAVSVYQNDVNKDGKLVKADGDQVYLYIGMRRGGEFLYALDVSDPDDPRFMWKINRDTAGPAGTKPFAKLGQTWSTIRPTNIKARTGPVVIFGGGYDNDNEDPDPAISPNTIGTGIYVVDAATGAFVTHINPTGMGAIPADLTFLDRDTDGKTDRIYAADTKGNVWRVDIFDADPTKWVSYKIAELGGTGADGRKFLNKVDVVLGSSFDAVLVGSGDREHPFKTTIVDRFYMIKDKNVGLTGGLFCGAAGTETCKHSDLTDVTSNDYQGKEIPATSHGWYLTFLTGEKLVSSPITVFGTVIFGTNAPKAVEVGTCGNLGDARLYQLNFKNGGAVEDINGDNAVNATDRNSLVAGGGYLPSAVYSPVMINGKRRDVVCVGTRCFKPGGTSFDTRRQRTYWYKTQ